MHPLPPPSFGDLHPKENEPGLEHLRAAASNKEGKAQRAMESYLQFGPQRTTLLDVAGACRRACEAQQKYYAAKGATK